VIDVALLGIIRRWHLRDQISLREIAKRLGISRNTVRRYLRSETVEPAYADRRSASALDVYTFKLSAWLKTESTKSRKQKRSLKQMHADLCVLGFEGSYDRVAAFARQWKVDQLDRVNAASKGTTHAPPKNTKGPESIDSGPFSFAGPETNALHERGASGFFPRQNKHPASRRDVLQITSLARASDSAAAYNFPAATSSSSASLRVLPRNGVTLARRNGTGLSLRCN